MAGVTQVHGSAAEFTSPSRRGAPGMAKAPPASGYPARAAGGLVSAPRPVGEGAGSKPGPATFQWARAGPRSIAILRQCPEGRRYEGAPGLLQQRRAI